MGEVQQSIQNIFINKYLYSLINEETFRKPFDSLDEPDRIYYIGVLKYVIENLLGWSPEEMVVYFNDYIISRLKLEPIIKALELPPELVRNTDYFYYAHLCYPKEIPYSEKDATLYTFRRYRRGEINRLNKRFTLGSKGQLRAAWCLQECIRTSTFTSWEDIYKTFWNLDTAKEFLKKNKLDCIYKNHYASPLDYLHSSLPYNDKNEGLYLKYSKLPYKKHEKTNM